MDESRDRIVKLPGAYKNRGKRRWPQDDMVRIDCPGCDWNVTARLANAERAYQRHLTRIHEFPHIAPRKDPQ